MRWVIAQITERIGLTTPYLTISRSVGLTDSSKLGEGTETGTRAARDPTPLR